MTSADRGTHDVAPAGVSPGGRPLATPPPPPTPPTPGSAEAPSRGPADQVGQPAKLIRIGSMVKQLLGEVRDAPLDQAGRDRLRAVHAASIRELKDGLSPELGAELGRLAVPFGEGPTPSVAELRIAQAQLVGWLEGVFHGIQLTLFLQQTTARAQLAELRGGPPPPPQMEFPPPGGTYL